MDLFSRRLSAGITALHGRPRGRLTVLSGARQTGKSTLVRAAFPDHDYIDFDAPTERAVWARLTPADWIARHPRAILDEAQKLPEVFDTIKAVYDRAPQSRYVLLGSSQILLLDRVRESLAGRAALRELFAFSVAELAAGPGAPVRTPPVEELLVGDPAEVLDGIAPERALNPRAASATGAWERFLRWGGMPALHAEDWTDGDRWEWLQDYQSAYLQRDLRDLARIDRLEPFVRAMQAAALRSSQPINFSELARLAGVAPQTARQFVHYLEVSYQVVMLPAWYRNAEKRLTKRPRVHFLDPGIRRCILNRRGDPDGTDVESGVVAEFVKCVRTNRLPVQLHHLRTHDQREVDLLIERDDGYIAVEIKQAQRVASPDARGFRGLDAILDKPLLAGLVLSHDTAPRRLEADGLPPTWAIPIPLLFG